MFTQTFIHTNGDSDPAIVNLDEFAAADTTDTTGQGFANSSAVLAAHLAFLSNSAGFVESLVAETATHRVSFVRVWDTEADRDTYNTNFKANVDLYNSYTGLMDRFRTAYNITTDPAPGQAPHYYP